MQLCLICKALCFFYTLCVSLSRFYRLGRTLLRKEDRFLELCTHVHACMLSHFSCVRLFETLWTVASQAPLSIGFSRQEYWSRLPCPPPADLPDPRIEPTPLGSPAMAGRFFTTSSIWEALELYTSGFKLQLCQVLVDWTILSNLFHIMKHVENYKICRLHWSNQKRCWGQSSNSLLTHSKD